ncbi:MAG TPA: hypothetical protein VI318_12060 [Baekduia sp.]
MPVRSPAFLPALVDAILRRDVGELTPDAVRACAEFTVERVGGAPSVPRFGLDLAATVAALLVRTLTRRPFARLDLSARTAWLGRLERLPLTGQYVDAVRSLALTYIYEAGATA